LNGLEGDKAQLFLNLYRTGSTQNVLLDISLNWEYFEQTFNSYALLTGYSTVDAPEPTKKLAALKYALPKETRLVLKNTISLSETDKRDDPAQNKK